MQLAVQHEPIQRAALPIQLPMGLVAGSLLGAGAQVAWRFVLMCSDLRWRHTEALAEKLGKLRVA